MIKASVKKASESGSASPTQFRDTFENWDDLLDYVFGIDDEIILGKPFQGEDVYSVTIYDAYVE